MLGDVLVFTRKGGGHVGIYVGQDKSCYHVLGGNQGDRVSIVRIEKTRCIGVRRTKWKISQPKNVRIIFLPDSGNTSTNEQ
jgi:cell wall-associated NlpC family hydrolase